MALRKFKRSVRLPWCRTPSKSRAKNIKKTVALKTGTKDHLKNADLGSGETLLKQCGRVITDHTLAVDRRVYSPRARIFLVRNLSVI